jgi:tetratricopeptide (TPR) repeat protein
MQVCRAIQHAHQKGIIHRDIKPSNILVTLHDGVPVPKVIDFGIAKATQGRLTDKTVFTAFQQFIGTPAYMSPEQAEMSVLDIDTRSDIYSLGILLYELLTGKTPFDSKELLEAGLDAMRRTIREQEPERPSTKLSTMIKGELTTTANRRQTEPPKLVHAVRGDLDWIVMKALEKDRARRYETANGLARDIQRHLSDEPVVAGPPSKLYRFQKAVRRNKRAFAAGSAVAAALVLGLCVATWGLVRERQARTRAVVAEKEQGRLRQQAETEAAKSRQVAQFLKDMLEGAGPEVAQGRDASVLLQILDKAEARMNKELADQPAVEADLRCTMGTVYNELGRYQKAETTFRRALAIEQALYPAGSTNVADTLKCVGSAVMDLRRFSEAEALFREALTMRRKFAGSDNADIADDLASLAMALQKEGKLSEAKLIDSQSLTLLKKLRGEEDPEVGEALMTLAKVNEGEGNYTEAESMMRQALAIIEKAWGSGHPQVATFLDNLGVVLQSQAKWAEAEETYRKSLALHRKVLGGDHPEVSVVLGNLAMALKAQGKLGEAERVAREALELARRILGNADPGVASRLNVLAAVLVAQGKPAEAEAAYREALEIAKKHYGNHHPEVAKLLMVLSDVQANKEQTENLARDALAILRQLPNGEAKDRDIPQALQRLGGILRDQGRLKESEDACRECLERQTKLYGSNSLVVAMALNSLAIDIRDLGRPAEAEAMQRQSMEIKKRNHVAENDPENGMDLHNLAVTLYREGKLAEAETASRGCLAIWKHLADEHPEATLSLVYEVAGQYHDLNAVLVKEGKLDEAAALQREAFGNLQKAAQALALVNEPQNTDLLGSRGAILARLGRWKEAAADFSRLCELRPDGSAAWHSLAAVLVQEGDGEAYRDHCRRSLERFGQTLDHATADCIAKDCLILPDSGPDLKTIARLADTALRGQSPQGLKGSQFCKGLAEYRLGNFAEAAQWTQEVLSEKSEVPLRVFRTVEGFPGRDAAALAVLAMAQQQSKQTGEAQATLAKGLEVAKTRLGKPGTTDLDSTWVDWVIAHALLREARALIEPPARASDESK